MCFFNEKYQVISLLIAVQLLPVLLSGGNSVCFIFPDQSLRCMSEVEFILIFADVFSTSFSSPDFVK
jgi:hypothetical protein